MSKTVGFVVGGLVLAGAAFAALTLIDVDVEDTGELPSVDVDGGELPEMDVDVADVDVSVEEATVKVPDVDVDMKETTVPLPNIDIDQPDATSDEKEASAELNEGEAETDVDSKPE